MSGWTPRAARLSQQSTRPQGRRSVTFRRLTRSVIYISWNLKQFTSFGFYILKQLVHWGMHLLLVLRSHFLPFQRHSSNTRFRKSTWIYVGDVSTEMPFQYLCSTMSNVLVAFRGRGSSVGRARDSWWGGPGFDSRCGRPLPTGWVGVSIMWPAETEVMVSQLCFMCGST